MTRINMLMPIIFATTIEVSHSVPSRARNLSILHTFGATDKKTKTLLDRFAGALRMLNS